MVQRSRGAEEQYDFSAVITGEASKTINLYAAFSQPSEPASADEGGNPDVPQGPLIFNVTYFVPTTEGYVQLGEPVSVAEGALATEPTPPAVPDGYVSFVGWYISANKEGDVFNFSTPITGDINLYAHFSTQYLVSYQNTHGQIFHTERVTPGAAAAVPDATIVAQLNIPEGKIFDCWSTTAGGSAYNFSAVINADIVLYPVLADAIYVYYYSEGTQVDPVVAKKGDKITAPAAPARTGFTFKHWSTEQAGEGTAFNFATTPIDTNNNVFWLYAKWTGTSNIGYKVVYWIEAPGSKAGVTPNQANPGDFVYAYTDSGKKGTAGSTATVNTVPAQGGSVPVAFLYSQLAASSFSAEISGNGSTILNVYLVRKTYTYQFDHKNTTMTYSGVEYKSGEYKFDFKYQEDISDRWPGAGKAIFSRMDFYGWKSKATNDGSNWISMRYEATMDMMPSTPSMSVINTAAQWDTGTVYTVYYYAEALEHEKGKDGTNGLITKDKIQYKLIEAYTQNLVTTSSMNPKPLGGLTYKSRDSQNIGSGRYHKFYYTRNSSSLTFDMLAPASEVKNAPVSGESIKYGEKMGTFKPASEPTREGYMFKGWYLDQQFKLEYDFSTATMPKGSLLLYAKWESEEITVRFYDGETLLGTVGFAKGDSMPSEIVLGEGAEAKIYAIDNMIGDKQFKGWYYTGANNSTFILPAGYEFQKDVDLYAQWKTDGFVIKYVKGEALSEAGLPTDPNTYKKDTSARVLKAGTDLQPPSGKVFVGWKKSGETTVFYPFDFITVNGDITLEPVFINEADLTKLTYHANYGDFKEGHTFTYQKGVSINLPDGAFFADRPGYKVVGWSSSSTGGTVYTIGELFAVPSTPSSLYALWEKTTPQYTVTFVVGANGTFDIPTPAGGVVAANGDLVFTVDAGTAWDTAWVPAVTANEHYTKTGWTPTPFATTVTENLTYTMQYSLNKYTVTFVVGANGKFDAPIPAGGVVAANGDLVFTVDANTAWDTAWVPAVTANEHYTKTGWTPTPFATTVTENLTYTMQYSLNKYTVTFVVGANGKFDIPTPAGGVVAANGDLVFTVDAGTAWDTAWVPAVTANEHYTKTGWTPTPFATTVTGNLTYTMQYSLNKYTVTFVVGANGTFDTPIPAGGVVAANGDLVFTVDAGTAWDTAWVPAVTANEHYTKTGWTPTPFAATVTGNLTYTMQYSLNKYTVTFVVGANGKFDIPTPAGGVVAANGDIVFTVDANTTWNTAWVPAVTANEHYTKTGWTPAPFAASVTGNLTYTMQYSLNKYTVTFVVGANGKFDTPIPAGGVVAANGDLVFTVDAGTAWDTAWVPAVTANEHYTKTGWTPAPFATTVTGNLTYTMQYSLNKYTVTFVVGANGKFDIPTPAGGVVAANGDLVFTVDANTAWDSTWVPAVTANTGYRTNGWDPSPFATNVTGNLTYTMQYIKQYTVTFIVGANGTFNAPNTGTQKVYTVDEGTAWDSTWVPAVTAKAGFRTDGWDPSPFATNVTGNLTYTMQYIKQYTVTFIVGANGTFDAPNTGTQKVYTVDEGTAWDTAWVPAVTANTGYRTDGWDPSPFATNVTGNLTYTMQYIKQYTVTFIVGANGTFDAPNTGTQKVYTVDEGTAWDTAWVPAVTANTGYRTNGWDPSPFATNVTGNLTYTMQYIKQYTVTFIVGANGTFDAPNTGTQKVYTVDEGTAWDTAWVPAVTANTGYRTNGWDPSPFATNVTGNLTYTMQYIKQYTVTFIVGANGTFNAPNTGTQKVYTVDEGTAWDSTWVPAVTAKAGFRTDGWDSAFPAKIDRDYIITMKYVQQVKITFVASPANLGTVNGKASDFIEVDAGTAWDKIKMLATAKAASGAHFVQWANLPADGAKLTADVTITAVFATDATTSVPPPTPPGSSSGSTPRGGGSGTPSSSAPSSSDSSSSSASEVPPADSSVVSIPDEITPTAPGAQTWSLIDLIVSVVNLGLAILTLVGVFLSGKKDEDEEENENEEEGRKKLTITKILVLVLGVLTPILFIILENLLSKMVIVGPYTMIFAVLFVVQAVLMILSRKTKENREEENRT